jgi:hypothetical protein
VVIPNECYTYLNASQGECGQYAGLQFKPDPEALPSTACRVDGVPEAQSLPETPRGHKDRAARAEAGGNNAGRQYPEVPTVFPLRTKEQRAAPIVPLIGTTRDRISAGKRMSRIAEVYPAMPRKPKVEIIL